MSQLPAKLNDSFLIRLDDARRALAEARTIHETKAIRDMAQAAADLLRQQKVSQEVVLDAMELKLWAERRLGEMLREAVNHKGGGDRKSPLHNGRVIGDLPEGVTHTQSHRWQKAASLDEPVLRSYLEECRQQDREPTTAGVLKLVKQVSKEVVKNDVTPNTCTVDDLQKLVSSGKKFGTIYADPPWAYGNQATRASTDNHYATLTVEEICALPVAGLVSDTAHLHLWTTNAFLFESKRVLESWGFEYKSVFVWVKPQIGIGNYWRVSHEFLILGTRGPAATFPDDQKAHRSWEVFDRQEHSRKPQAIRRVIELVSPGPRLELFGRQVVDGWTVWGNQIDRGMFDHDVEEL